MTAEAVARARRLRAEATAFRSTRKIRRVLIVDDSPDNREVFMQILLHHGFSVGQAGDGEDALRAVREVPPDLILMDLSMPRLDGIRTTRILKADGCAAVPIVAITARPTTRRELEPLGFSGLLRKPVPMTMLVAAVHSALNGDPPTWIDGH